MNLETPGHVPEEFREDANSSPKERPITRREMLKATAAMTGAAAIEYHSVKDTLGNDEENSEASEPASSPETEQKQIEEFEAELKTEILSLLGSSKLEDPKGSGEIFVRLRPSLIKGIAAIEPVVRNMEKSEQFKQNLDTLRTNALRGSMLGLVAEFLASKFFPYEPHEKRNVSRRRFLASLAGAALGATGSAVGLASVSKEESRTDLEKSAKRAALCLMDKYHMGGQIFSPDPLDAGVGWGAIEKGVVRAREIFAKKLKLEKALEQYSAIFHILDQK